MLKKLLSLALCVMMMFTLTTAVFAEGHKVGEVNPNSILPDKDKIQKAIEDEYNAQKAAGFNPGEPMTDDNGFVHDWSGVLVQNFTNGDSTSKAFDEGGAYGFFAWKKLALIYVVKIDGEYKAFTAKNQALDAAVVAPGGDPGTTGAPISNEFVKDGVVCQNYQKGAVIGDKFVVGEKVEQPAAETPAETTTDTPAGTTVDTPAPAQENPKTGDAGAAAYVVAALIGLAGAAFFSRKKATA